MTFVDISRICESFMHLNQYIHTHILTHLPSISSSPNKFQKQRKLTDMEASPTIGVYPLHRSKIIHLVRHAEGIHNAAGEEDYSAYSSEEYADAHITPLGWQQVDALRKHVKATGLSKRVELVVVSPLLRTLQTAVGAFGGEEYTNGVDVPPLMVANAGNSGRPAVSSLNCPSFLAVELCREIIVDHPCDRRRSVTEYQALFPSIDFSLIESDRDFLWKPGQRESVQEAAARGVKFINWLWTRKETEIVVVSHRGFLRALLSSFGNDCHTDTKKEMSTRFVNCELRSIAIIDRGMIGTGSSTTNYPGKTPQGLGLASDDVAEEKMDKENALNNTS